MDRFNRLGRGLQLMLVGSVLLLIDTFLNWQSIDTPIGSFGRSAWHGFGGVLLGLLVILLVAWLAVQLAAVDIQLPVSATLVAAFLGFLILIVAVLKNLVDDYSSFWSYVGIVLAAVIAVGAWMQVQETGGVESLKSEATSLRPPSTQPAAPAAQAPPAQPTTEPTTEPTPQPTPPPAEPAPPPPQAAQPSEPPPAPAEPSDPTPATTPPASPPTGGESSEPA